ncbi:hypothetical protein M3685_13170 [Heyndrickxia oleronia]|uniref:hypothetical protein n=1 Tax=Heyndrickxia TaxID=2837504 RepID=UPI0015D3620D|nr:hypothetical protein [Heyndrickxia oleronia]MCM3454872.1 hypothetical protein [Heyndrickxia oleronia]NYV66564.1 hypothetical protein [Bacillus sp. Gen3]
MNVHLVFSSDHIQVLTNELGKLGFNVTETDTSLDTFEQWATSTDQENKSEVAFVYGAVNVSKYDSQFSHRQAVFDRLRTVRISRPELRIILVFTSEVQEDTHFLQKLIQIGIYDLYFEDEITVDHILNWLSKKKTLADVQHLITNYNGTTNDDIGESQSYFSDENQVENDEIEVEEESKSFRKKDDGIPKKISHFFQREQAPKKEKPTKSLQNAPTNKFGNFKINNPFENIKMKTPSFSLPSKNTVTGVVQPKVIAVGSLHGGAGSTFLIHNFLDYLSDEGLQAGVLEATEHSPVWLQIRGREIGQIPTGFESWISQLKNTNTFNSRAKIENQGIYTIPISATDLLSGIDIESLHTVIFTARQIPLLFVDISTDWDNPLAKETLKICDEFWVVVNPDPNHFSSQRHKKKTMMNVAYQQAGEDHCIFIGNKWGKGVNSDEFPLQPNITIPYFEQAIKSNMDGKSLYSMNPRLFKTLFNKLGKKVIQPIKTKQSFFQVK